MREFILKIVKLFLHDWSVFYIYRKQLVEPNDIASNLVVTKILPEKYKISFEVEDKDICRLTLLWGNEYKKRNFIKLDQGEAKVISVITAEGYRNKGYAVKLLYCSEGFALKMGIDRLYARIWHSNIASIKTFEKAGWSKSYIKISFKIFNIVPIKFNLPTF